MLIRSTPARVGYSVAFGLVVSLTSIVTGAPWGWALSLGLVTVVLAFAAQTYYVKRKQRRQ